MILLLSSKEGAKKDRIARKFKRYGVDVKDTGIDKDILQLLIETYIEPEFKERK